MPKELYNEACKQRPSGAPPVRVNGEEGRSAFQKDYSRLIHAPSFRRLQGKTQLFPGHEDDFFRNRLTHSLEVAQISSGVANRVNIFLKNKRSDIKGQIDIDLVEFAALAHDLGHPPFGHNGEAALDELMTDFGGFEGNAQTLHILASVEAKQVAGVNGAITDQCGLDLTYRTLAAVLKYDNLIPANSHKRSAPGLVKGYYQEEQELVKKIKEAVAPGCNTTFKSIECSIMDIADDIAYSTYDLEDSLHAKFVTPASLLHSLFTDEVLRDSVFLETNKALSKAEYSDQLLTNHDELLDHAVRIVGFNSFGQQNSINTFNLKNSETKAALTAVAQNAAYDNAMQDPILRTAFTAERVGRLINGIEVEINENFPMLSKVRLARDQMLDVEILKHLNYQLVIRSHRLAIPERRGKEIVIKIFNILYDSKGELLDPFWKKKFKNARDMKGEKRVICDYVAGMTDRFAVELHDAFFGGGKTIFKPS
jgi:dGTPase